jgi:hypothetical protein
VFDEGLARFATDGTVLARDNMHVLGPMCFARGQLVAVAGRQILYFDIHQ